MKLPKIAARLLDFNQRPEPAAVLISAPTAARAHARDGVSVALSSRSARTDKPYVFHTVPFIPQQHVNMCADACIGMLAAYHGREPDAMTRNPRGLLEGLDSDQIHEALRAKNLAVRAVPMPDPQSGWSPGQLAKALRQHGPMVCSVRFSAGSGHAVLLVGASDEAVVMHDPWRGPKHAMPIERFNAILAWDDDRAMLAAGPRAIAVAARGSAVRP